MNNLFSSDVSSLLCSMITITHCTSRNSFEVLTKGHMSTQLDGVMSTKAIEILRASTRGFCFSGLANMNLLWKHTSCINFKY